MFGFSSAAAAEQKDEAEQKLLPHGEYMERDMQKMFELGLALSDIERMWKDVPGIDMSKVMELGAKLLGDDRVPLARQARFLFELEALGVDG